MPDTSIDYCLYLADNSLIIGHRNSEWCGHGPVLEQDIAITNISLDLIGQARNFYQYAAQLISDRGGYNGQHIPLAALQAKPITEDTLAYLRDPGHFLNCLMLEQPKGDWAFTILRQFLFSNYQFQLFTQLENSADEQLAAIAAKSLKEVTYHLRWSSEWVIRLGDGTDESATRMKNATEQLAPFVQEFFVLAEYETDIDSGKLMKPWMKLTKEIFDEAGLALPNAGQQQTGGKEGRHSKSLESLLEEMQTIQRNYPDLQW